MVKNMKLLQLPEMEQLAKQAMNNALKEYISPPDEVRVLLTLGRELTAGAGVFELYVPADRPQDAKVIGRTTVNRSSGEVTVEVFLPRR